MVHEESSIVDPDVSGIRQQLEDARERVVSLEGMISDYTTLTGELKASNDKLKRNADLLYGAMNKILRRDDLGSILHEISEFFTSTGDFLHSEINVFTHDVRTFAGEGYSAFMKRPLAEIIDSSVSKFSESQLKLLEKDIKQSAYMAINSEKFVHVADARSRKSVEITFSPIYTRMSEPEIDADISDKLAKAKQFGVKSHLSALLSSQKSVGSEMHKIPIGYFHLTKKAEFSEEDMGLINTVVTVSALAIDNYFNMKRKTELLEQIKDLRETDVSRTRDIMKSLIPDKLPVIRDLDFASLYVPTDELGGDFYDVFPLDEDRVGMIMGDVCGHGIPSALIATVAKSAFIREFKRSKKLSSLVRRVSEHLSETYPSNSDSHLTAFVSVFNRKSRELTYCNAGHPHPLIYKKSSKSFDSLKNVKRNSLILFSRSDYSKKLVWGDCSVNLRKGDYLFAFTDGLTDCFNKKGIKFNKRLCKLGGRAFNSSDNLLKYVINERKNYADRAGDDDVACLVMGVK